jgi:MFS family permease
MTRYHLTALSAGTLLAARGVGAIVIGAAAAMALRRTGYRLPLAVGFIIVAVGTVAMAISPRLGLSPYAWLSIGAGLTGLGNGMANPASRNACLQLAPNEVAAITGLRQMFVFMGIIFSVSTVTAILNRSADPGLAQAHILWVVAGVKPPYVQKNQKHHPERTVGFAPTAPTGPSPRAINRGADLIGQPGGGSVAGRTAQFGTPRPLARSKPTVAWQHPTPSRSLLPVVMSKNAPGWDAAL